MNAKKIIHKTEKLLKKTSIYSEQYYLLLNGVFEPRHTDMRENFEFTARGIRVYCFERGKLVFEGCASEAEAVFLAADSVIHQIALDIVINDQKYFEVMPNGCKRLDYKAMEDIRNKAFEEIGGIYSEMCGNGFGMFRLKPWNNIGAEP